LFNSKFKEVNFIKFAIKQYKVRINLKKL